MAVTKAQAKQVQKAVDHLKFLTSGSFRGRSERYLRALTGNYKNVLKFAPGKICTDGDIVFADPSNPNIQKLPSLTEKILGVRSDIAHESFHILYTNFTVLKQLIKKHGENFRGMVSKDYLNIVEDAAIELAGCNEFPGVAPYIRWSNDNALKNLPPLEDFELKQGRLKAHQAACLEYVVIGKMKGELHDKQLRELFEKSKPYLDKGRVALTTKERCEASEAIVKLVEPLIKEAELLGQLQQLMNPKGNDMTQQGQGEGRPMPQNPQEFRQSPSSSSSKKQEKQKGKSSESKEEAKKKKSSKKSKQEQGKEDDEQQNGQGAGEESEKQSENESENGSGSSSKKGDEDESDDDKNGSGSGSESDDQSEEDENGSGSGNGKGDEENESDSGEEEDENGNESDGGDGSAGKNGDDSDEETDAGSPEGDDDSQGDHGGDAPSDDLDGDPEQAGESDGDDEAEEEPEEDLELEKLREEIENEIGEVMTDMEREQESQSQSQKREERVKEHLRNGVQYSRHHQSQRVHHHFDFRLEKPRVDEYNARFKGIRSITRSMTNRLRNLIRYNLDEKRTGQTSGYLNQSSLWRRDGLVFAQKKDASDEAELCVLTLNDMSGSMQSFDRWKWAILANIMLAEVCENLKIPFGALGHQARYGKKEVDHFHFVKFERPIKDQKANLTRIRPMDNTREGISLKYAGEYLLQQPQKDKLLIVISDGEPFHNMGGGQYFAGDSAKTDAALVVEELTRKGITVIGVAIGDGRDEIAEIYKNYISIPNLNKLPQKLIALLEKRMFKDS